MKQKLLSLLILLVLLVTVLSPASAQSLKFQVPREVVNLYLNKDGTATIEYFMDFQNSSGGALIDYIDVGMPEKGDYDLNTIIADVDGKKITDIAKSTYVDPGVALGLGANSIRAGQRGQVHVVIKTVRKIFYEADQNQKEKYTSFGFSPSWFDSQYVSGVTDLTVNFFFNIDLQPTEPIYFPPQSWPGDAAPTTGVATNGMSFYSWRATNANAYTQYTFGGAFPARLIPASTIQTKPLINISTDDLICVGFGGCFALIFGVSIYSATIGAKKRKLQYLTPKIAIEGLGIKRGLTPVEAAILMETPMDKVMTMILFSTVKKGAASVVTRDPLKIEVTSPAPDGLYQYETDFLAAFNAPLAQRRNLLQTTVVNLVKSLTEKMKGFSRKETVAYYQDIMKKAWEQVEAAQTPDIQMQAINDQLDWTMLDHDFDNRTRTIFNTRPVYVPIWWGHYDPGFHTSGTPSTSGSGFPSGGISIERPNVPGSAFAASIINGTQSMASGVVGDVTNFTSGITNLTNPVPVSTSTGTRSGGGGGHSCACACACAGCACACAGGGR